MKTPLETKNRIPLHLSLAISLCVFIFFSVAPSTVMSKEKLSVYLMVDYPPYSWLKEGEEHGIDVEILRELNRRTDIDLTLKFAPWKRILNGLEDGSIEAAVQTWWRKERTHFIDYMSVPLRTTTISIVGRKNANVTINQLSDLNGLRIGKMRAFSISSAFDDAANKGQFELIEVDHLEQAVEMLEMKRLDIFVHSTSATDYHRGELGDTLQFSQLTLMREEREGTFLVLSKPHFPSGTVNLIRKLDTAVSQMHNDGTIAKIFKDFLEQK